MPEAVTPGLVCAHHHLYSALARGMPAPPATPTDLLSILGQIWWRLDAALDLDIIEWSAKLGALEALECGTTAIIDHHESPNAIEGSLDVIAAACAEVGVRTSLCYGVTDRWNDHGTLDLDGLRRSMPRSTVLVGTAGMTDGARRGLAENERFLRAGGRGYVGVHAAFTCTDATLEAAAGLAAELGTGVHVHLHEGPDDAGAADRLTPLSTDRWLLAHCVHLPDDHPIRGTISHQPRSNLNNAVGYARPARFEPSHRVVLGTDGIGADMLEEFRIAYVAQRNDDVTTGPEPAWRWLTDGARLIPEVANDRVTWNYAPMEPWHLAFTPGVRARRVERDGQVLLEDGRPALVDAEEIRARAVEAAGRLFARL
ncbi:MAG: amidohydrolase family protein [Acidimicrobiales bacterium]|nr:amidohydrolase family protein [Acidimicrobiales bacterium]